MRSKDHVAGLTPSRTEAISSLITAAESRKQTECPPSFLPKKSPKAPAGLASCCREVTGRVVVQAASQQMSVTLPDPIWLAGTGSAATFVRLGGEGKAHTYAKRCSQQLADRRIIGCMGVTVQRIGTAIETTALTVVAVLVGVCAVLIALALIFPNFLSLNNPPIPNNHYRAAHEINRIIKAERQYAAMYSTTGFTCDLDQLASAGAGSDRPGLLDKVIAGGVKSGYQFALANCADMRERRLHYTITAVPQVLGRTGQVALCASEQGMIWYSTNGSAGDCLRNRVKWDKPDPYNW